MQNAYVIVLYGCNEVVNDVLADSISHCKLQILPRASEICHMSLIL